MGIVIVMPKKKTAGLDTEAAKRIAQAFVDLKLDSELADNWVVAVREAGAEYPSEETISVAREELIRLLRPPVQIVVTRSSHKLRRHSGD